MDITKYLSEKGFLSFEGYSQEIPQQVLHLRALSHTPKLNVMEIGFNAGHSAEIFLQYNSTLTLTSFDLGSHDYCLIAKEYIDTTFPNRHTLILGDSTFTVPHFHTLNPDTKFDLIFIDGGHDYEIATADILNCKSLAHKDTIVILDDTVFTKEWEQGYTVGPTQAWNEQIDNNLIRRLRSVDYMPGRGMSWGKYIF